MALPLQPILLLTLWITVAVAAVNPDANAFYIQFNDTSIGPDGPWWFISQAVDYPDQFVNMLPGITRSDLVIYDGTCSTSSSACPLPIPPLLYQSGAWVVSDGQKTIGGSTAPGPWDLWTTALLRLKGTGKYLQDRMTLHENGVLSATAFLDWHAMMASFGFAATFPGGSEYTLDTGFLSLYAASDSISWSAASNNSVVSFNRTLPNAYYAGYIPSMSYGLHVGSFTNNLTASLVVGGYDSSRCLTDPIVSDTTSVQLKSITLGVVSGESAWINPEALPTNALRANGSALNVLEVYPKPEVPYLYLPRDTCDQLAQHLPVTYSEAFNLYLWNTDDPAYRQIISSPHYIAFTFTSGAETSTINIPMALLNLTLESPLVRTPKQYFPCSPWTPSVAPYHLGRAFLQGAFLAQNWQTGKLFLAQAPGPDLSALPSYIKNIATGDTAISPATKPPSWADTWASTLKDLPKSTAETTSSDSSGLSGGAIAGIVIGVVALLAIIAGVVFWLMWKRKRQARSESTWGGPSSGYPSYSDTAYHGGEVYAYRKEPPMSEAAKTHPGSPPVEMDATRIGELPAYNVRR